EESPERLTISDVQLGVNYVMIISTNAGLWGYNLGDTVQFVSLDPYRVVVSGRIKHFISAFGEHVIAKEVEEAMREAIAQSDARVNEFSVAPRVEVEGELPYHEWLVEFEHPPTDINRFLSVLDRTLQEQNSYYYDLIAGKILQPLKVTHIKPGGFQEYMKSIGKLGGQNKVQRLANDCKLADALQAFRE
ncbi:MAG: GH3 auxin-responsive promoter family protein, partial [Eudoraea sp.]|nr:GH3 auxin-responsive promoter family protein [Eudoraea sp.]